MTEAMENTENGTANGTTAHPDATSGDTAQSAGSQNTGNDRDSGEPGESDQNNNAQNTAPASQQPPDGRGSESNIAGNNIANSNNVAGSDIAGGRSTKPTPGLSLHTRLAKMESGANTKSRKKKLLLYGLSAVVLIGVAVYFTHQIRSLVAANTTGMRTPEKRVYLDSSAHKVDPLAVAYEKENRNHYQDSLHRAIEKDAMGHIVMDWSRLYDLRRREVKKDSSAAPNRQEQASLSQLEDSLALALEGLQMSKTTRDASGKRSGNRLIESGATGKSTTSGNATPGNAASTNSNRPGRAATTQPAYPTDRQTQNSGDPVFNVVHGPGSKAIGNGMHGNRSGLANTATLANTAINDQAEAVIVRAVVYGNHKVKSGSKVAFRLLEPVTYQGVLFAKNTILIGLASFRNGRAGFSGFRSKSLAVSTHAPAASTLLPLACYDTDMIAGIAVSDQSPVETQARQAGSGALSDAANDLSYAIPYGAVARAASTLTQGVSNGKRQKREMFIGLSDGYPVLLELMPAKEK